MQVLKLNIFHVQHVLCHLYTIYKYLNVLHYMHIAMMKPSTHIYYTLYNPTKNRKANINVTMIKHVSTIKDDPPHT